MFCTFTLALPAVPNMAVYRSSLISCFPGTLPRYCLSDSEMIPSVHIITGITFTFTFYISWISIMRSWYFKIFSDIIIIVIIITISLRQGIYTYIPETNNVPKEYNVAAILSLLFMVPISLVPALALMYVYISTFLIMCAGLNMAVFCSSLNSWFHCMVLTYFLNDFEMVPVAPIITGSTLVFTFHMRSVSIITSLYLKMPSASFWITFLLRYYYYYYYYYYAVTLQRWVNDLCCDCFLMLLSPLLPTLGCKMCSCFPGSKPGFKCRSAGHSGNGPDLARLPSYDRPPNSRVSSRLSPALIERQRATDCSLLLSLTALWPSTWRSVTRFIANSNEARSQNCEKRLLASSNLFFCPSSWDSAPNGRIAFFFFF
jgi:hypothetical protein